MPKTPTISFVSLGCSKNLVDSERMLGLLAQDGYAIVPDSEPADMVVVNTCGFIDSRAGIDWRDRGDAGTETAWRRQGSDRRRLPGRAPEGKPA